MSGRKLLGMLTPSSNTVLEPVCAGLVAGLPEVSCHFGRFRVTEISLGTGALGQFADEPMLVAARLLADAKVDVISWNGTSGGWLGIDADRRLCERIREATGIAATTSVLALDDLMRQRRVARMGLVSPYRDDVQALVTRTFHAQGFECVAERHLGISENFAYSTVTAATITDMVREVAREKPDVIVTFCTNMRAAPLAAQLEAETGIPIFDSTAAGVWGAMRIAGVDTGAVKGWGTMFTGAG